MSLCMRGGNQAVCMEPCFLKALRGSRMAPVGGLLIRKIVFVYQEVGIHHDSCIGHAWSDDWLLLGADVLTSCTIYILQNRSSNVLVGHTYQLP